jgi:hypothetical protein
VLRQNERKVEIHHSPLIPPWEGGRNLLWKMRFSLPIRERLGESGNVREKNQESTKRDLNSKRRLR